MRISTLFVATLALGLAACEKPSDLGKLDDEANATVARYQPEVAELDKRVAEDDLAGKTLPEMPDTKEISDRFGRAVKVLGDVHGIIKSAASEIAAADRIGPDALHKFIDETNEHYEMGIRQVSADLTTVEAWIGRHQGMKLAVAAPPVDNATPPTP